MKVKRSSVLRIAMVFVMILLYPSLFAQTWNFIKEKDGIKIYTRTAEHSSFKCFKGETVFHTTMEKLSMYIGNVQNVDWWDKNVSEIKVIFYEPDKLIKYYLVYDVPWPLNDRDLCVEARITIDPVTGEKIVSAKPLLDVIPEREGIVRIRNYWQKWTLKPEGKNNIHAVLEGFVDPGGSVPSWLYNMVIVDTPLKVMRGIKVLVEEKN
ncbi:MAG: hypothetical protein NTW31_11975 [Bacteroidetes bacterium]|nr:hypothetical protein [Bacteroidota bacterium]